MRLAVYDVLGREFAVLVNENKAPGYYTVTWDAGGVSSGVYFYRIQILGSASPRSFPGTSGVFTETRKLLLVSAHLVFAVCSLSCRGIGDSGRRFF